MSFERFRMALALCVCLIQFPRHATSGGTFRDPNMPGPKPEGSFPDRRIRRIDILVSEGELTSLKNDPRRDTRAKVRFDDAIAVSCDIHLKGTTTFQSITGKPSFTLKSKRNDLPFGSSKIHLNNSAADTTLLRDTIGRSIFGSLGVPVAKSGHAVVFLNHKCLGTYLLVEGINRRFLESKTGDASGRLFEGELEDITGVSAPDGQHRSASYTTFPDWEWSYDEGNLADYFVGEILIAHEDGGAFNCNNFWLYVPKRSDAILFPHTMDAAFRSLSLIGKAVECSALKLRMKDQPFRSSVIERLRLVVTNTSYWTDFFQAYETYSSNLLVNTIEFEPDAVLSRCHEVSCLRRTVEQHVRLLRDAIAVCDERRRTSKSTEFLTEWDSNQPGARKESAGKLSYFVVSNGKRPLEISASIVLLPGKYRLRSRWQVGSAQKAKFAKSTIFLKVVGKTYQVGSIDESGNQFDFQIPEPSPLSLFQCRQIVVYVYLTASKGTCLSDYPEVSIQNLSKL